MVTQNLQLAFVANNGKTYPPDSEIGRQMGYITWTPSKLRITLSENKGGELILTQNPTENLGNLDLPQEFTSQITTPKVLFYENLGAKGEEQLKITIREDQNEIEVYVGGLFQPGKLYNGASPQQKDITIKANINESSGTVDTMIRIRRNANQLTAKAKKDYIQALSNINERDKEGIAIGMYSTDFFQMHVKGSKSIAHGSSVFLPWHRLYLLDLERQLQKHNPEVSLHYWKFDEPAPHIFKADFLGESVVKRDLTPFMTEGFSENFAKFNEDNPLKNWAVGREKLIRRFTWFNNQEEQSGYNKGDEDFYLKKEYFVYNRNDDTKRTRLVVEKEYTPGYFGRPDVNINDLESFSWLEINPHGEAHTSINGFLNYVPTAPKDPLFFFLHSNVERFWAKWQVIEDRFEAQNPDAYPKFDITDWKNVEKELWPWEKTSTPNQYRMLPPGSRVENFTRSVTARIFDHNIPKIEDAIDGFGKIEIQNYLGFGYDDSAPYCNEYIEAKNESTFGRFTESFQAMQPNTVHQRNKQVLAKIVSDNPDLMTSFTSENTALKSFGKSAVRSQLPSEFINLDDMTQYYTDLKYLEAVHNYDISLLGEVEHQFDIIRLKVTETTSISKGLIVYILAVINNEKVQDDNIKKFFDQSTNIFALIKDEEYLDLLITLFTFASNTVIRSICNEKASKETFDLIRDQSNNAGDVSIANKYWALQNLINNALDTQS